MIDLNNLDFMAFFASIPEVLAMIATEPLALAAAACAIIAYGFALFYNLSGSKKF